MTGNLQLVTNSKLRSLLTKGPKFREKERINWDKVQENIINGINNYVKSWANYEKVDIRVLSEWSVGLKELVKNKIERIIKIKKIRGYNFPICIKTLNRQHVKSDLQNLHKNYIFVQIKHKIIFPLFAKNFTLILY